jgi:predicted transcriptional regulator
MVMRNTASPLLDREECAPPRLDDALAKLPARVRDIATLRGLGFTCLEIGHRFGITPQAVSATLSRHHRRIDDMRGCPEMSELSARSVNALSRIGVNSRAEACGRDIFTLLLRERNCGAKSLEEIRRWLERGGTETGEHHYL